MMLEFPAVKAKGYRKVESRFEKRYQALVTHGPMLQFRALRRKFKRATDALNYANRVAVRWTLIDMQRVAGGEKYAPVTAPLWNIKVE